MTESQRATPGLAEEHYALRDRLDERGVIFSYVGYISDSVLVALGDALRQKMAIQATDNQIAKRVFSVFVEQVQNVIRYAAERESAGQDGQPLSSSLITVGCQDDRYFVVCGNVVMRHAADHLRGRLEQVTRMDKTELRRFYKEKLRESPEGKSQGASVGLIEIARRVSDPLAYDFKDLDDDRTFFCLKTFI